MKKLTASIFTVLLATVGAANAQIASKAYVDAGDGNYIAANKTAGENIKALDTQLKANTDKLPEGDTTVAQAIAAAIAAADPTEDLAGKADKATGLTGATKTKITYNDQGIVTGGADLVEADIPALSISKTTGLQDALDAKATTTALATETSAREAADTDINDKIGTVTAGKTVVEMIEDAQSAATYDDTALAGRVTANENAISTINASDAMNSGITSAKVSQYDAYATGKQDKLTFDSTPTANSTNPVTSGGVKAALDTAASDVTALTGRVTTAEGKITTAEGNIETLQGDVSDLESGKADKATTLEGYGITDAYTKTETDGKYQTLDNLATSSTWATDKSSDTKYASAKAVDTAVSAVSSVADGLDGRLTTAEGKITTAEGKITQAESDIDALESGKQDKLNNTNVVNGTGTGNVVTSVVANNGTVTVDKTITAIPAPTATNENGVYVLTATTNDGTATYAWEQIARGN